MSNLYINRSVPIYSAVLFDTADFKAWFNSLDTLLKSVLDFFTTDPVSAAWKIKERMGMKDSRRNSALK